MREREAETQAEGEAGSTQGAQCGTRAWVSSPGSRPGLKVVLNCWATGAAFKLEFKSGWPLWASRSIDHSGTNFIQL